MARKATKAAESEQDKAQAVSVDSSTSPTAADASTGDVSPAQGEEKVKRFAPDPFPFRTVIVQGVKVRLQQSRRFNQMQIKFGEGKLDEKPSQDVIDFVKAPQGEDGPKFHWNNTDRAWALRIDMNNPATSRQNAERIFDQVVERLREEHGEAIAR